MQLNDDPPPNGAVPMLPMFEVQSLSMQLGPETNDFQVEGANTSSDADIFSPNHKVTLKTYITQILSQPILSRPKPLRLLHAV